MNKKKLISNFTYQIIYQLTIIVLPIITIPRVSHSLGVEGIGIYNYIMSIVSYFVLTAGLGLSTYGIREIASSKREKVILSKKFWELEFFNLIIATLVLMVYIVFILIFIDEKLFFIIGGISLFATLFDISWFYYGIQDFKQITIINMFIKIFSFFLILFFVNTKKDLGIYFVIQSGSILVSNVSLWFFLKSKVCWIPPTIKSVLLHLKPALHYFIGKISITLYTTLNKTLLGVMGTTILVGIYTNSLQLVVIFVTLIGTLDTVLLPHMTSLFSKNDQSKMIGLMEKSIDLQLYFTIPLAYGIIATNKNMIPWFFGKEFIYLEKTVPVLAPLVIIMPLGISIVRQYLMPQNKIKQFNISVLIAAVVSILLNLMLIPLIGIWGVIISTLISESIVTIVRIVDLKKNTNFSFKIKNILIYFFSGLCMLLSVNIFSTNLEPSMKTTCIQIFIGVISYISITSILNMNPLMDILKILHKERQK
ncbi:MAG: polysaccharide biosynthesis C-terminal domain-containing protein [Vagococcus sp.]|uniref:oligosaccharide flippase family protein n=1 Tax=Vagococcus sp. TaxID=1933889 RepID=UPI002FCC86C7